MFYSGSIVKSIARRVFPDLGAFSPDQVAKLGLWDAILSTDGDAAWLTVSSGRDVLFQVETSGGPSRCHGKGKWGERTRNRMGQFPPLACG